MASDLFHHDMTPDEFAYASFLLRMLRVKKVDTPDRARWQCEIEQIQSGQHWKFSSLPELLDFIEQYATGMEQAHHSYAGFE